MKIRILITGILMSNMLYSQNNELASNHVMGKFKWNNGKVIDLGKIEKGKPVSITYKFTNIGSSPLIISNVKTSCGCTDVEYNKEPVNPGAEGFLKVTNNASNSGYFNKSIIVYANVEGGIDELTIKGETFSDESNSHNKSENENISAVEAFQIISVNSKNPDFIILDVRTTGEYSESHIEQALNIDKSAPDFETQLAGLDKNKQYLLYCKAGVRSAYALEIMKKLGFKNVSHIKDGIDGWKNAKFPLKNSK